MRAGSINTPKTPGDIRVMSGLSNRPRCIGTDGERWIHALIPSGYSFFRNFRTDISALSGVLAASKVSHPSGCVTIIP